MMVTAKDFEKWQTACEIAKRCDLKIKLKESFSVEKPNKLAAVRFESLDELFMFLCGYANAVNDTW